MQQVDLLFLDEPRRRIDAIDARIVALLGERMAVVRDVISIKRAHAIAARLDDRVEAVVAHARAEAEAGTCPPDLAEAVWRTIIEWTIRHEEANLAQETQPEKD